MFRLDPAVTVPAPRMMPGRSARPSSWVGSPAGVPLATTKLRMFVPTGKLAAGKMTVTSSKELTSLFGWGARSRGGQVTVLVPASNVPPPVADTNCAPAGNVSVKTTPLRFWVPPAASVSPTR